MDSAWAQLVSLTDIESSAIPIHEDKFVIGRNNDCDLSHVGNILVSNKHCFIERNKDGKVFLHDTSTNGTLLNLSIKLRKGEYRELHHGDEIHIVHKKNDNTDIGYMFQEMKALQEESSSDFEDTQENTQVMSDFDATLSDDNVNVITTPSPLKKRKSTEISPVVTKKIKTDSKKLSGSIGNKKQKEEKHIETPTSALETNSDVSDKKSKTSNVNQEQANTQEQSKDTTEAKPAEAPVKSAALPEEDAIAENLICIICQELLYDCISLQPCMHSFCSGCYSEWMERSHECPSCRVKVARINKNHIVNNLVEAYLKTKPDKRRPEAELQILDSKNKITRDMLYPVKKTINDDYDNDNYDDENYDGSDGYDDEDEEGDDDYAGAGDPVVNYFNNYNQGAIFNAPLFGAAAIRPAQTVCRQCRGYTAKQNQMIVGAVQQGGTAGVTAGPSTAGTSAAAADDPDAKTSPTPPDFICPVNGNHVLCQCCFQPMPDRRNQYILGEMVPPQQCYLCLRHFCHAYWGCQRADCQGCIAQFKDLNFGKKCLTSLILDNAYESKVLADYLKNQGITVRDVFKHCLAKINTGEYVFTNQASITSHHGLNTPVCYSCGMQAFKELAYFYRRDIPADKLPKEVTSRSDCYWGKNCRTQRNKPEHAQRFNHICYQSRVDT